MKKANAPRGLSPPERLLFHSERNHVTGCQEWIGALSSYGYPILRWRGMVLSARRLAWEIENGPIPIGTLVRNHCDNRKCIEIKHLFLGSHRDNMA